MLLPLVFALLYTALSTRVLVNAGVGLHGLRGTAALSVRLYDLLKNRRWGFFAADGKLQVKNLRVFTRKNEIDRKID